MNLTKTEAQEQAELVWWLELMQKQGQDITFTAIPNATYTTSWSVKARNVAQGVRKGLPDLFLIVNGNAFFIELKRTKGGRLSPEQEKWIEKINEVDNLQAYVCKGAEEAKQVIS